MKSTAASDRLRGAALRQRCVALRASGLSYEAIGQELGCSRQNAWRHTTAALAEIRERTAEDATTLRDLEAQRLDEMQKALWPSVLEGELPAIDRALRLSERRCRLLGLDAPSRAEVSGPDGSPIAIGTDLSQLGDDDVRQLAVVALNVVHPGPSEAEVSYPYEPATPEGNHRVRTHRNAKTTPKGRALMVQRVTELGWTTELPPP